MDIPLVGYTGISWDGRDNDNIPHGRDAVGSSPGGVRRRQPRLPSDGILDNVVGWFGFGAQSVLFTWPAVIVGMVHVMLPFLILPLFAALKRYDDRLSQASLSLGASRLRTFVQVKLPVLSPQLAAGTIAIFILSLGFYITPAVLGGPRTQMISNLIAQQVFQRFDVQRGYAIGTILIFTTLLTLAVLGGGVQLVRRRLR